MSSPEGPTNTLNAPQSYLEKVARLTTEVEKSAPEFAAKFLDKVKKEMGVDTLEGVNYHFTFSYPSGDDGDVYFGVSVSGGPALEDTQSQRPGFTPAKGMFNYGGFSYKVGELKGGTFVAGDAMYGEPLSADEQSLLTRLEAM